MKIALNYEKLTTFSFSLLVLLCLVFPTELQVPKIISLTLSLLFSSFYSKHSKLVFSKIILLLIFIYIIYNCFMFVNSSELSVVTLKNYFPSYVIWPILFTLFFFQVLNLVNTIQIEKIFLISFAFINIYILCLCLVGLGYLPNSLFFLLSKKTVVNSYGGYLSIFTPSITVLFFLTPYFLHFLFTNGIKGKKNLFIFMNILISLINIYIIGRRALILAIFVSVVFSQILNIRKLFSTKKVITFFLGILIIFSIFTFLKENFLLINLRLQQFGFEDSLLGGIERESQATALLNDWLKKPIFGYGIGVNARDSIRSYSVPGMYELSYHALLFQGGLIGLLIHLTLYFYIIVSGYINGYRSNNQILKFGTTGLICLFIGNFSNPYIQSFDSLFIVFLILMMINKEQINIK
ncbi:O-antigen ligase family protein [Streptococcus suis]